ncbi:hypothetical protein [Mycolicibacterium fortuitum]|uniref:hypothetical protein n=1 Tax=Mycolicibacterium fortuitum TaxID=1766 RepID=UPI001AF0241F|nr:hypothetical protein [Mycolicibacterium fortuitum]MBP3083808.1 hypothetical protein [Mycolicibacterium fortuitum]
MDGLAGKHPSLESDSPETLKVIAHFDALSVARVGLEGLLRAAAALADAAAGAERHGHISRYDSGGQRLDADEAATRFPERTCGDTRVWLERHGAPRANDEIIVERLALAVELLETRRWAGCGLDIAIDAATAPDIRKQSLALLGIGTTARIRVLATSVGQLAPDAVTTVVPTRYGMMRATVDTSGNIRPSGRIGLGTWVRADRAPESWEAALIAYRLTDSADPVVDATDLGAALLVVRAYDPDLPHDDVTKLANLDAVGSRVLRTLVEADSIRSAASRLGMHHSSIQARYEALIREIGYDPRTPLGRLRYSAAVLLLRLQHTADQ